MIFSLCGGAKFMRRSRSENDPEHDPEVDMVRAARLAEQRTKQIAISSELKLSQAAVSRLLAEARNKGYLCDDVRFLEHKVPAAIMQRVNQQKEQKVLADCLDRVAKQHANARGPLVRVFKCGPGDIEKRRELGRQAAPYVKSLVLRSRSCGVTWGGTLQCLVSALREMHLPSPWYKNDEEKQKKEIICIPLSGEPLGDDPTSYSSSSLAHELGCMVNGGTYSAPSLAMVPAFIPKDFSKSEVSGVWRLIGLVESYDLIFGKTEPLAAELDMILTSVGPLESPLGFSKGRLLATGGLNINDLQKLVIGDLGGVCFPRQGLSEGQERELEGVTKRWTGLKMPHLRACSQRGVDPNQGPPGVVVVSGGAARARFVYELIKLGIIQHLFIDDVLANELGKIAQCQPTSKPA
jgi:predicted transcriptional regulator